MPVSVARVSSRASVAALWVIAGGVIIGALYLGRAVLAPFVLALVLFLTVEGLAQAIERRVDSMNHVASRTVAIILMTVGFAGFVTLLVRGAATFGERAGTYERKINQLIESVYTGLGIPDSAPRLGDVFNPGTGQAVLGDAAAAAGAFAGTLVLVLIYTAFLFAARSTWDSKLDNIWTDREGRDRAGAVSKAAAHAIGAYLYTQTIISVIITAATFITLLALDVNNAVFLSAIIFGLNFIPTIGSIIAAFVPALFALVQTDIPDFIQAIGPLRPDLVYAIVVTLAVGFWQFAIGNFLQPRMMADSLNLSALVVLLSLAVWGALWGPIGVFLSAPLTVIVMILLAQSDRTRWIAVLLSRDGHPDVRAREVIDAKHRLPDDAEVRLEL